MNKITNLKLRLLAHLPYYHSFLSQCSVYFTENPRIQTAAIGIKKNGEMHITINEEYYDKISEDQQLGIIQHEILHLVFGHLKRYSSLKGIDFKLLNVAEDIAINQMIEKQYLDTKNWMTPERFKFPLDKTSEDYYFMLLKEKEKYLKENPQDDHGEFEIECSEKLADAIIKDVAYKAYKQNYGNLNQQLNKFLTDLLTPAAIPWQNIIRKFIGMNISSISESSRTRANRRLGLKAPGNKKEYKPSIGMFRDESGSMCDETLQRVNQEFASLLKAVNAKVNYYAFDTELEHLGEIDSVSRIDKERKFSGGTSFVPIFEEAEKKKFELIVIFTDGYGEMPNSFPKKPILWILDHNTKLDLPGTVLYMPKEG